MPYAWPFLILLALQAATIAVVRDPGSLPGIRRHPLVGLLPLLGIGGMVIVLGAWPGAVDAVTALAAIAVPILALLAGLHVRRWAVPIALAAPLLWLVAWRFDGSQWADLAGDILIVLAAAVIGVFVATGVDIWQVARIEVQPVAQALGVAEPPSGLPSLQELRFRGATMGWGDAYLAAVAGAIVAVSRRATVAAVLACGIGGAAFALLFLVVDYLPATVPVAFALLVAGLVERRAVAAALRSRPWAGR
jgi:hypothetical protein